MNTEEIEYPLVDGFKMIDEEKDRNGNILHAIVNEVFEVNIMSRDRYRDIVDARRIYSLILREQGYSYTKIGKFIRKDHATVLHYHRNIDYILKADPQLKQKYLYCRKRYLEDIERADAVNAEAANQTMQAVILNLRTEINSLRQRMEYLEVRNESLSNQNEWYDKELSQYNPKLKKLYNIITNRTKAGTVGELSKKINTLYNGVYSEVIEVY
jgi:hypothetical protein